MRDFQSVDPDWLLTVAQGTGARALLGWTIVGGDNDAVSKEELQQLLVKVVGTSQVPKRIIIVHGRPKVVKPELLHQCDSGSDDAQYWVWPIDLMRQQIDCTEAFKRWLQT